MVSKDIGLSYHFRTILSLPKPHRDLVLHILEQQHSRMALYASSRSSFTSFSNPALLHEHPDQLITSFWPTNASKASTPSTHFEPARLARIRRIFPLFPACRNTPSRASPKWALPLTLAPRLPNWCPDSALCDTPQIHWSLQLLPATQTKLKYARPRHSAPC